MPMKPKLCAAGVQLRDQVPIICEGLGIIGIAVDERGTRYVLESQALGWIEYEHFLQEFKTKHQNNVN